MMVENLYAKSSVRTRSGIYVNLIDPKPETISIEDIAQGLSQMPRFCGQLPQLYSVAQHCVFCVNALDVGHDDSLATLMHDATEAYIADIPGPIKSHLPDYKEIEDRLMRVIASKFGFEYPFTEVVKAADKFALEWEWENLMLHPGRRQEYWTSQKAKKQFLRMFFKIHGLNYKLQTA